MNRPAIAGFLEGQLERPRYDPAICFEPCCSAVQSLIGSALAQLQGGQGVVDWFDYCTRLSEQCVDESGDIVKSCVYGAGAYC